MCILIGLPYLLDWSPFHPSGQPFHSVHRSTIARLSARNRNRILFLRHVVMDNPEKTGSINRTPAQIQYHRIVGARFIRPFEATSSVGMAGRA